MIAALVLLLLAQAEPALPGAALTALLRSVKKDGPVTLPPEAQADLVALPPPARRGEECAEQAKMAGDAQALKDRGDGPVLVAALDTCKGARIFAFAPGTPTRVARLLDAEAAPQEQEQGAARGAQKVKSVRALNLRGGKRDDDLGLELATSPTTSELRLFTHRDTGFAWSEAGRLPEFATTQECAAGAAGAAGESGGWASFLRVEKAGLQVLRADASCGGAPWQASCIVYKLEKDGLARGGVCALPPRLDAKALQKSGWR